MHNFSLYSGLFIDNFGKCVFIIDDCHLALFSQIYLEYVCIFEHFLFHQYFTYLYYILLYIYIIVYLFDHNGTICTLYLMIGCH